LYVLCGLLFIPSVSQAISNALQILCENVYPTYNSIQRKYFPSLQFLAPPFQNAQRISFAETDETESDVTGNAVNPLRYDEPRPSLPLCVHVPFTGATVTLPGGAFQFYTLANDRRSIRKFSTKNVDYEIIKKCIQAAGTSPSGAHTEPWTFCVVACADMKAAIRDIVEREEYENYSHRMSRQWTVDLQPLKTDYQKEYLTEAPYLILVFKQIYGLRADGTKKQHYYNEISVSIAVGILLCALQAAGLNSLITTPLNCGPALRDVLQRPANEKLQILIPVGFAADDCEVPDLHRKSIDEILVKY